MAERRRHLTFVALIGATLIGIALLALPGSPVQQKPTLGLDLQGGLEVVLKAEPPEGRPLEESDLDRSVDIIRERIDKLGVSEPTVTKQGEDQISVQLPGVKNAAQASTIIGKTAKLELYDLETSLIGPSLDAQGFPVASERLFDLLSSASTQALVARNGEGGPWYLFEQATKRLVAGPAASREALLARRGGDVPEGHRAFVVPKKAVVIRCGIGEVVCPGVNESDPRRDFYYLFKLEPDAPEPVPQMTGTELELSGTRQDFDPQTGGPVVLMQFTNKGEDIFHDVTRDEAQRGRIQHSRLGAGADPRNFDQHFAIVLDGEIKSWPSIDFDQYPDGISGSNGAQITGIGSVTEAKNLAVVLQTGALPVEFVTLQQTEISATLGEDSLREALRASIAGMIIVAIFLLVFYRFLGVVAVLGLAVYAAFLYAVILLFNVTLTLPGFAGMILTIGVAADANIVIFERIKEEARAGKSVRAAISAGYSKGFATIVDANVVTAITAIILFVLATSGVRGFAFLLLLGTAISVVTAVFATRALLGLLGGFRWFDNPAFMGAGAREIPAWQRIDIVGRRRLWFTLASLSIVLSIVAIAVKGLNLGIDFKGGTEVTFATPQRTELNAVRDVAGRFGEAGSQIQGIGSQTEGAYREFKIRTKELDTSERTELQQTLQREFKATDLGTTTVSASFSEQILRGAIYAMIFSFILISIYVTVRFQWRFAVPILRTIVNDGMIAVGVYAVSGREVTAATVAAFLTIIGYSIYDTIIIFDRVRENLTLMRRATMHQIVNTSLWETIPRSLATTFITLLPVGTLFVFGGETLKDFAFAILIGIGVSAFSTIFIAAPFLAVLMERHPEYKRRAVGDVGKEPGPGPDEGGEPAKPLPRPPAAPQPALAPAGPVLSSSAEKRERRRQRRRARPHGRAR